MTYTEKRCIIGNHGTGGQAVYNSFFQGRSCGTIYVSRLGINRRFFSDINLESLFNSRISMSKVLKYNHPFSCIVSGPRCGKSSFCIRFQQNLDTLRTEGILTAVLFSAIVRGTRFPRNSWRPY